MRVNPGTLYRPLRQNKNPVMFLTDKFWHNLWHFLKGVNGGDGGGLMVGAINARLWHPHQNDPVP